MSVTTLATTSMDKLFLEFITPGMEKQYILNTTIYGRFKTQEETCLGKYGVAKIMSRGARSARPSSTSTFPTAAQGSYDEFRFYMKRGMYATLQFDGLMLACSKGAGAIKDVVKQETEGIIDYISDKMNKQFWGDGSGRLAQLSAAISNTTTGYVDGPLFGQDSDGYTPPSKYLYDGMAVDIYTAAGVLEAEDVIMTAISKGGVGTDTITFASNVLASNDSYIFDHDTYAGSEAAGTGVPMGLYGIINSTNAYLGNGITNAFQNINRSSYPWAKAQVFTNGDAAINDKKLLEVVMETEQYGSLSVIVTNAQIWRNYSAILQGDKTMPNTPAFWGGITGITFYGGKKRAVPVIYDYDCPDNRVYFIDDSKIIISAPIKNGMDWLPGETGHILSRVQGKDEWNANLRWYYNMTCTKPLALAVLTDVAHKES
jgi:hypothetical protein